MKNKYLIIGGDSKLGKYLSIYLEKKNFFFLKTSRKKKKFFLYLDLKNPKKFKIPNKINYCFFLAGVTDYEKCEKIKQSRIINVNNTVFLIKKLINKGVHVNFISSNTVFGGITSRTNENDKKNPKFAYAKHKSHCEDKLLKWTKKNKCQNLLSVTRLTKILDTNTRPFPLWKKKILLNKKISCFEDYYFSPISFEFVCKSLIKISNSKYFGIFHLSNKENINYFEFSKIYFKPKKNLIKAISLNQTKKNNFYYKPIFSNIKMSRTKKILNIAPEKIKNLLKIIN